MVDNRGIDMEVGRENREHRSIWKAIESLRSERRAAATTISDGDLTVENGGGIRVKDQGTITVEGGVLRSVFIFLSSALQPSGMRVTNGTPGSSWSADFGSLAGVEVGVDSATLPIHLKTATNDVRIDHATTSSSANAVLDAVTKTLARSTSSRRYKQDIQDHAVEPDAVLRLQPRTWRDRLEVEQDPTTDRRYVGFIAEEVHDLGLSEFVEYDEDGRPDAIAYDRLAVALLGALQNQNERIERLEQTTTALRGAMPKGRL